MTRELCRGLPPEYWDVADDGARLGLAICKRCPAKATCPAGDPKPMGVIRAGVAFADDGTVYPPCPSCGYPQIGRVSTAPDRCVRCDLPPVSKWRTDVLRWVADGVSVEEAGRRIGATPREIRVVLRPKERDRGKREAAPAVPVDAAPEDPAGLVDEVRVERALAGERMPLNDAELTAALQAGTARGEALTALSVRLGMNHVAAKRLLNGDLPPIRARRAAIAAALRADPHRPNTVVAAELGVGKDAVRRVRNRLNEQSPIAS